MRSILASYLTSHAAGESYSKQLEYTVLSFEKFLGRAATPYDLLDVTINNWLMWLVREGYAAETVRGRRRMILTLWKFAAEEGQAQPHKRIRRVPVHSLPKAWREDEIPRLLKECDKLRGYFRPSGVKRSLFARAFAMTAYETGFRPVDLLRIRRASISPDGLVVMVQSKTGVPHVARVRKETIEAVDAMGTKDRETIFGGLITRRGLSQLFQRLIARAGVDGGSIKWFRKSGATHVEKYQPGAAMRYLGHTTPRLAFVSYVDRSQLGENAPLPPKVG